MNIQTIKRLNKNIKYAHSNKASIRISNMDHDSLQIIAYSNAAIANNMALPSQLGRVMILTESISIEILISYNSYKSRRVVRNVISAGIIAFCRSFFILFLAANSWSLSLSIQFPFAYCNFPKAFFDIIFKESRENEK